MRIRAISIDISVQHMVGDKHYVNMKVKVTPDGDEPAYVVEKPELLHRHDFESRFELLAKRACAQIKEVLGMEADLGRT